MSNKKYPVQYITVNGEEIAYHRINADINGNPRYVVHFLDIGVEPKDYGKIPGLIKYRAKWFGGGYVFQSANVKLDLEWMMERVREYYKEDISKIQSDMCKHAQESIRKEAPWIL